MSDKILMIFGPAPPAGMGNSTGAPLSAGIEAICGANNVSVDVRQAESLEQMCGWLSEAGEAGEAGEAADALVICPGDLSLTSAARESLSRAVDQSISAACPIVEAHGENIFSGAAQQRRPLHLQRGDAGFISGLGEHSYLLALKAISPALQQTAPAHGERKNANTAAKVLVLNGPNLNLLGKREPDIYGHDSLQDISKRCIALGKHQNLAVEFKQSNSEGQLVEWVQQAFLSQVDALVINAGAYTHTSIALHDALRVYEGFKIELHISNPHLREPFRHISHIAPVADAAVMGLGVAGYEYVIELLPELLA